MRHFERRAEPVAALTRTRQRLLTRVLDPMLAAHVETPAFGFYA
jgi:hypothetical protein